MATPAEPYRHTKEPSLYAYRKGCHCAGCKAKNTARQNRYNQRAAAKRSAAKAEAAGQLPVWVGPVEAAVRAEFDGMAAQPWQKVWMLLACQHAHTLDVIAGSGQMHLAGTAHAKLSECLDRLKPPPAAAGQAVKQGITELEAFANDL